MDIKAATNGYRQKLQGLLDEIELDEQVLPEGDFKNSLQESKFLIEELRDALTHFLDEETEE